MDLKKRLTLLLPLFYLPASLVNAQTPESRFIVAPNCLLQNVTQHTLASNSDFSFIKINRTQVSTLMTNKLKQPACGNFIDVTLNWKKQHAASAEQAQTLLYHFTTTPKSITKPSFAIHYQNKVNDVLQNLNPQNLWSNLTELSNYNDRHANSATGIAATKWMKSHILQMAKANNRSDVSVQLLKTDGYKQPSVIVKIGTSNEPAVIVSAHIDTVASTWSKKPGADDDGSGSVTVLEAARLIIESGLTFKNPIYFIWYAAEEEGLVGSQQVLDYFQTKKLPVAGVLHFDLTGYAYKNDPTIWLMNDNTSSELNTFLASIINTYVKQPIKYTACGYACSDHATWYSAGYKATIAAEAEMDKTNPYIHSSQDTMDKLSLPHMTDYAKIATAFAIELGEPNV